MIATGVVGAAWRAVVLASGDVVPHDGEPLTWCVAADDRWHVPAHEPTVRQRRLDGTPVIETRVRVPTGDVVQLVYSVADRGGVTVIEVSNESALPVAVAFSHRAVLTERPIADVPIEGIELPPRAFVLPLGHRATVRIGLAHREPASGRLPDRLPGAADVVRGWLAATGRASRFVLPDGELDGAGGALAEQVTAARCELLLAAPPDPGDDPAGFLVRAGELVRMGERPMIDDVARAVELVARDRSWESDVALVAAHRVLVVAGETRAERDLQRIVARRSPSARPTVAPPGLWCVPWLESWFADGAALWPHGWPDGWLGQSLEAHGVPTSPRATVSLAVRWHGERPALLWEQQGDPVELTAPAVAPGWSSVAPSGETLLQSPPVDVRTAASPP